MTMTVASMVSDSALIVAEYQGLIATAIGVSLGLALLPMIKRWFTRR